MINHIPQCQSREHDMEHQWESARDNRATWRKNKLFGKNKGTDLDIVHLYSSTFELSTYDIYIHQFSQHNPRKSHKNHKHLTTNSL